MHTTRVHRSVRWTWAPELGVAALAGMGGVAGSFLAVGFTDAFVGAAVGRRLLGVFPDVVFAVGVTSLEGLARPLLLASATLLVAIVLAALTVVAIRLGVRTGAPRLAAVGGTALVQATSVGLAAGNLPSAAGAGAVGGVVVAVAVVSGTIGRIPSTDAARSTANRRGLLRSAGVLAGAVGIGGLLETRRDEADSTREPARDPQDGVDDPVVLELLDRAERRSFDFPEVDPLVSRGFYKVDINLTDDPDVAPDGWSLLVDGAVEQPTTLTYGEVTARSTEYRFVTLRCVSDELNGYLIDTALWTGTPLAPILEEVGVGDDCCVRLEAADGYYHAFPLEALRRGFLAWEMNGKPLPRAHGAPVRVLIPGHWGEVNVKWLTRIEVREEPATGYWEERGWHGSGPVETVAKLHHRERDGDRVLVGGHAYAGTRGVGRVEISTDGGRTWTDAELSEPLPGGDPESTDDRAMDAWRMWKHEYERGDEHEVVVRVRERDGTVQPKTESEAFPSGATGWVRETVYENRE